MCHSHIKITTCSNQRSVEHISHVPLSYYTLYHKGMYCLCAWPWVGQLLIGMFNTKPTYFFLLILTVWSLPQLTHADTYISSCGGFRADAG